MTDGFRLNQAHAQPFARCNTRGVQPRKTAANHDQIDGDVVG
jgi:hypothetical protein